MRWAGREEPAVRGKWDEEEKRGDGMGWDGMVGHDLQTTRQDGHGERYKVRGAECGGGEGWGTGYRRGRAGQVAWDGKIGHTKSMKKKKNGQGCVGRREWTRFFSSSMKVQ